MYNDRLLINGELVPGAAQLDVINPATGKKFTSVGRASREQLDAAVAAANAAQPSWYALGREARGQLLLRFAKEIGSEADSIARALTLEQGKPLAEAAGEVAGCEYMLQHYAAVDLPVEVLQDTSDALVEVHHRPLGVVAAITPWNFPLYSGFGKLPPALILGNTFIWKPAPTTPVAALMIARIAARVFPAGVVNVIVDNNDLGGAITSHPGIRKIAFTGSTATGRKVMQSASETLKRITLELGGNDAAIVLEDADVESIAPKIFAAAFGNAGQVCLAIKRVYAHESIYERLCAALSRIAQQTVVGDGLQPGVQMGPIQNLAQFDKARQYLEVAGREGKIVAGGHARQGDGYFIEPTVVRDIDDESILVKQEQFSPILPVLSFKDVDEALQRANNSPYGLGGSVWCGDLRKGREIAARLDTGTAWVNQHLTVSPAVPFGGAKQSGIGVELGREGLEEFAQMHVVSLART